MNKLLENIVSFLVTGLSGLKCLQEFSEHRFFAFIFIRAD